MTFFIQLLSTGLMVGCVYSLVALGFVLIYRSSQVFNFAQGSLVMLGGYLIWTFMVWVGLPVWLGVLVGLAASGVVGYVIDRFTIRPLIGQPLLSIILLTLGLYVLIDALVVTVWGGGEKAYPQLFSQLGVSFGEISLPYQYIGAFIIALVLFGIFTLFLQRTKIGLAMRAASESHKLAQSTGISVKAIFSWSWVIAAIVAAAGGFLLGNMNGLSLSLSAIGLRAFPVVLLGGVESVRGCIIAGPIVGILEIVGAGYLNQYVGGGMADVIPYVVLVLILVIKPYGLFGETRIERI